MMEKLYVKAEETGADIVKGGFDTFMGDEKERFFFPKSVALYGEYYDRLSNPTEDNRIFRWIMFEWLGIYRKSFLDEHGIRHQESPGAAFQDIGFWFLGMTYATKVYLMRDTFYHYRQDNPNASVKNPEKVVNTCSEYEYIRTRIESDSAVWNRVRPAYWQAYFQSNMAAYEQLSNELQPLLSKRMNSELRLADGQGEIKRDLFDVDTIEWLKLLLKSSDEFDHEWRRRDAERTKLRNDLIKRLGGTVENTGTNTEQDTQHGLEQGVDAGISQVVIFGAGSYGVNFQYLLNENGIKPSAFADNDREKHGQKKNGLTILSPDECWKNYPECKWLVSNMLHTAEIRDQLLSMGVKRKNIICCDPRDLMRLI